MSDKHKVDSATVVDPVIIKLTRDTLGQYVKRPPLTEKLLSKPPFRFLHDIMTAVISTTGFMAGLFLDAELDSEKVKDKEAKIAFLQKAIDMVSMVTGRSVRAKPTKIVAGQEPEKTNEFLQALAEAISKKVDNDEYVTKALAAEADRRKASSKTNKLMSPRKANIVKESRTEARGDMKEDHTDNYEAKSDKLRTLSDKKEIKGSKSDAKTDKKEVRSDSDGDKLKPLSDKKEHKGSKSDAKTDKKEEVRSDSDGDKLKPLSDKKEHKGSKSDVKTDKKEVRSDSDGDKLKPLSDKKDLKGSESEAKTDKKEARSDRPVAKIDKTETSRTDKSEAKSNKLESRREKRTMKNDKQDVKTDTQTTRSGKEASGKLKQDKKSSKVESKIEQLESSISKHGIPITEQMEVPSDQQQVDGQRSRLLSSDVKESSSKMLTGDTTKDINGHASRKTGAVHGNHEPGRVLEATDNNENQESRKSARQRSVAITQSVDSSRLRANQVASEKPEAKTELPGTEQKVTSVVSNKEDARKGWVNAGGKSSSFTGEKLEPNTELPGMGLKVNDVAVKKEEVRKYMLTTGGRASYVASEKHEGKKDMLVSERKTTTKSIPSEQPKSVLAKEDGSAGSRQAEVEQGVNARHETATDKQGYVKALRNDELKKQENDGFSANQSSSSLTSKRDLTTLHDKRDVQNILPVSIRQETEMNRNARTQDAVRDESSISVRGPDDSGHPLRNPAQKRDLQAHSQQSAQDGRDEWKRRKERTKGEKRMDGKGEKRKSSVSKQDIHPDKLGPRPDRHEMYTIEERRNEKTELKSWKSTPKSEGEKTEEELQMVPQKVTTGFDTVENQRFENEYQKLQIDHEQGADVILDRKGQEDEDDEAEFLVRDDPAPVYVPRSSFDLSDDSTEHGGLVKKILKTKKGLEALVISQKARIEIDRSEITGGDTAKQRQRALLLKDISKLRSIIQTFTGNVTPLVRILDFLQEDLDSMQNEMEQWKHEVQANTSALQQEQHLLESAIEPLQVQLSDLEKQIEEQEEVNAALKSQALQNEDRIRKMITTAALLSK